ncbi:MAG: hypothetical protein QOJ85_4499 [Solirubrobacteraceae bacterium]|nr:hypothetical protein [Solirubrobacteraceae bacterium]MEA2242970.1 hypothetical protein [Solirubrobacteraceae bacterium]
MRRRRPDELTLFTAQAAGLVHDVLPAAETVREIVDAANTPIGRSDPLGLRPVTDRELDEIRNHMGRGGIQKVVDGALGVSGAVSAATAVAALACAPIPGMQGVALGLGAVSAATGIAAGYNAYRHGDTPGAVVDVGGAMVGAAGVRAASTAARLTKDAVAAKATARANVLRDTPGDRFLRGQDIRNTEHHLTKVEGFGKAEDLTAAGIATGRWGQETLHNEHRATEIEHEKDMLKALIDPVELRPAHIRPGRP